MTTELDAQGQHLVEYAPVSLGVLRQSVFAPGVSGIAARRGVLYTYTGEGHLLTFDANTLQQTSGIVPTFPGDMDLAFDEAGRLFGTFQGAPGQHLVELRFTRSE